MSPKVGVELQQRRGHEQKVVVPQDRLALDDLIALDFQRFCLQPIRGVAQTGVRRSQLPGVWITT